MRLYSYWRSSSAWRVRIALAYKNIAHEVVPVHLIRDGGQQRLPAFLAVNPLAQVPVLEIDAGDGHADGNRAGFGQNTDANADPNADRNADTAANTDAGATAGAHPHRPAPVRLSQSMAIIQYLDERFPMPPLLPRDALLRAHVRQLAEMINSGIQPLQNLTLQHELRTRGIDPQPVVAGFVRSGLAALEQAARGRAGTFLVGDAPTLGDVYLVPQLYAARRLAIDADEYPLLRRVEIACEGLPAFAAAHPDAQPDCEPFAATATAVRPPETSPVPQATRAGK